MLSEMGRVGRVRQCPWCLLLLCLLAFLIPPATAGPSGRIDLVLSEAGPTYRSVADAFVAAVAGRHAVKVSVLESLTEADLAAMAAGSGLLVPVGSRALRAVRRPGSGPLLTLLVPRAADGAVDNGDRDSAVFIDQPPERTLAFSRLVLPRARRVGIVLSAGEAGDTLRGYGTEAARHRFELVVETVRQSQDLPGVLNRLLPQVDALLLVPDALVVNENTVRLILIASYRQKVPVIGFSRGLSHAGAVAALVSSPAAIGRQGGLMAAQWQPGAANLPPARYPDDFEMVFNRQVARSLAIVLPEGEDALADWQARLR